MGAVPPKDRPRHLISRESDWIAVEVFPGSIGRALTCEPRRAMRRCLWMVNPGAGYVRATEKTLPERCPQINRGGAFSA